jgi:hypothetical protein
MKKTPPYWYSRRLFEYCSPEKGRVKAFEGNFRVWAGSNNSVDRSLRFRVFAVNASNRYHQDTRTRTTPDIVDDLLTES